MDKADGQVKEAIDLLERVFALRKEVRLSFRIITQYLYR